MTCMVALDGGWGISSLPQDVRIKTNKTEAIITERDEIRERLSGCKWGMDGVSIPHVMDCGK